MFEYEGTFGVVTPDGDIKGVFNPNVAKQREGKEAKKGTIRGLMPKLIKAGGVKLDNYDGRLTQIYENEGFRVVGRVKFSEDFAPEGWNKEKHGTPDVVAMIYDPDGNLNIEEKTFENYDEMMAYRDSFLDAKKPGAETTTETEADAPQRKADKIIEGLEKLKKDLDQPGTLQVSLFPGQDKAVKAAINVTIGAIRAGDAVVQAIEAGYKKLKELGFKGSLEDYQNYLVEDPNTPIVRTPEGDITVEEEVIDLKEATLEEQIKDLEGRQLQRKK